MYCQTAVITALVGNLLYILKLKCNILNKLKTQSMKSVNEDSLSPNLLVWRTNISNSIWCVRERTFKRSQYYYKAQIKHVCHENVSVVRMLIHQ